MVWLVPKTEEEKQKTQLTNYIELGCITSPGNWETVTHRKTTYSNCDCCYCNQIVTLIQWISRKNTTIASRCSLSTLCRVYVLLSASWDFRALACVLTRLAPNTVLALNIGHKRTCTFVNGYNSRMVKYALLTNTNAGSLCVFFCLLHVLWVPTGVRTHFVRHFFLYIYHTDATHLHMFSDSNKYIYNLFVTYINLCW